MQKIISTTIIKKGDIVEYDMGKRKVLEIVGGIYFLSMIDEYGRFSCAVTIEDFIYFKYSLDTPVWSLKDLKDGDEYWYIVSDGYIENSLWDNDKFYLFRLKSDNIFQTKKSAEARLKEIMDK